MAKVEPLEKTGAEVDIERIMAMIPHRYPFLMVDRVTDIIPWKSAIGIKNVSVNEPHFQGHFSGRKVMPGVLIIEAMAQTAAVLVVETLGAEAEGKLVYFLSVDNARFRKPVIPGDSLHIHITTRQNRGKVWKFDCEARVNGVLTSEATITAMIVDD